MRFSLRKLVDFDLLEEATNAMLHRRYLNLERVKLNDDEFAIKIKGEMRIVVTGGKSIAGWLLEVVFDFKVPQPPPIATVSLGTGNNLPFSFGWGNRNTGTDRHFVESFLGPFYGFQWRHLGGTLWTCMITHGCDIVPSDFVHDFGNPHVYHIHTRPPQGQFQKWPKPFLVLITNSQKKDIDCFVAAVDIVRGLTGSEDGLQFLANYFDIGLPSLSHLLAENKEVSEPAAEVLINLFQNSELIKTTMDILYKQETGITHLLVMFLVNLAQLDAGIDSLLQIGNKKMPDLYVMKLVRSFCASSNEKNGDPFEHVGSILVNISKREAGSKLLLDHRQGFLKQNIRQFESSNSLQKKRGLWNTS
ncbi:hypothetical protein U1Q18_012541 [Sarracenia purpurea var. burkii]